ncbi:MAG: hypothetical protein WBL55_28210, partial [Xanthobacteraceae bacterium]
MSTPEAEKFDLVVSGGAVIVPGVGSFKADVAMIGGKVAAIGNSLASCGKEVFDASGKHVLPGFFDPHTHIGIERSY